MGFDEQPEGPHDECAREIALLNTLLAEREKELADNKKYMEGILACHQQASRDVLRFLNQAREAEARADSKTAECLELSEKVEKLRWAFNDYRNHIRAGISPDYLAQERYEAALAAAPSKDKTEGA